MYKYFTHLLGVCFKSPCSSRMYSCIEVSKIINSEVLKSRRIVRTASMCAQLICEACVTLITSPIVINFGSALVAFSYLLKILKFNEFLSIVSNYYTYFDQFQSKIS